MSEAQGKVLARMPPSLHAALLAKAREEDVSLNQLIVALLAGGIGFKMPISYSLDDPADVERLIADAGGS
jgi:hypothetical protein